MLTFTRHLVGQLIPEAPRQMQPPFLAVITMTTSTGAQGADYQDGFNIGSAVLEQLSMQLWGILSCDVVQSDGSVSPGLTWSYGENGRLRGFNTNGQKEISQTTDVPPNARIRMVWYGV